MSSDLFVYNLYIDSCEKESNKREAYCWKSSILWKKARDKYSWNIIKWSLFMAWHIWSTNCWKHYCKASWVNKIKMRHTLVSKIYWSYLWKLAMREIWSSFIITTQDKEMKIWEWNMEFIVGVQSLTQHSKSKWWRNQPRWLVRGTKQALVERWLTMCANC